MLKEVYLFSKDRSSVKWDAVTLFPVQKLHFNTAVLWWYMLCSEPAVHKFFNEWCLYPRNILGPPYPSRYRPNTLSVTSFDDLAALCSLCQVCRKLSASVVAAFCLSSLCRLAWLTAFTPFPKPAEGAEQNITQIPRMGKPQFSVWHVVKWTLMMSCFSWPGEWAASPLLWSALTSFTR